ncbi:uncharacterized protein V6R79_001740 [Siganus canaliculatus]
MAVSIKYINGQIILLLRYFSYPFFFIVDLFRGANAALKLLTRQCNIIESEQRSGRSEECLGQEKGHSGLLSAKLQAQIVTSESLLTWLPVKASLCLGYMIMVETQRLSASPICGKSFLKSQTFLCTPFSYTQPYAVSSAVRLGIFVFHV